MSVPFANGSVHGEISALPDIVFGQIVASGIDSLTFIDFGFHLPGHSTHSVTGLLVGTWQSESLTFQEEKAGSGIYEENAGGTFVLRPPGFAGRTEWNGQCRGRYLVFSPEAVERKIEAPVGQLDIGTTTCSLSDRMTVFHLLTALGLAAADRDSPTDALLIDSVALAVLRACGVAPGASPRKTALTARQVRRIRDLVADRIGTPLSLGEMAEAVSLSESYFVRAFRGSFGITPYQYVLRERVALAQSLIRSGTVTLSEAASRAGFPDARRMGRTFRKVTGRSPTAAAR
ncbi:helix-turn-helix domain-containing protein [Methylorubrum suomiense]|uniref:HTH-type transcriptional activator RhaR n=1 Tax=Methylorubrum suomiense TaxID=144191 RepID=A0ABQ4V0R4_9HYPH|nr:AraC family transcriptional regulator [Methylorubrum suomiense]GJE78018.1 HTH-type transcriptional activator RhaR [Methylorubrum suomiense]